jgi:hypothetical protein
MTLNHWKKPEGKPVSPGRGSEIVPGVKEFNAPHADNPAAHKQARNAETKEHLSRRFGERCNGGPVK